MRLAPVLLLLLAACPAEPDPAEAPRPKAGGPRDTLVIATGATPDDLLWVVAGQAVETQVIEATQFFPMDADFQCRLAWDPQLAGSWEFSADGRSVTVRLRDDVTWADGTPVTARDYAFTYALIADPAVRSPRLDLLDGLAPDARPAVLDAHTVRFDFDRAFDRATMLSRLNVGLAPAHLLDSPQVDRANLRAHPVADAAPVASGPFRVARREADGSVVLEPNPAFTGPKKYAPRLAKVVFRPIPAYADRLAALRAGTVDVMEELAIADADALAADHPEYQLRRRGWRNMDHVAWNLVDPADVARRRAAGEDPAAAAPHPLFGDRGVRRALAQAVDVEALIRELLTSEATGEVYARPAVGTITPAMCGVHDDTLVRLQYDPDGARARLGELGWADANHDGVLEKDGRPFRFTLLVNGENDRRKAEAKRIAAQLAVVGVEVVVEEVPTTPLFYARLQARDFDAALAGWSAGLTVNPRVSWGADSPFNFSGYRNPLVEELLARGESEPDFEAARPIWRELQRTIYEDQPSLFLVWADEVVAVHSRFQNAAVDIVAPYRRLWQWSVPIDRVKYPE